MFKTGKPDALFWQAGVSGFIGTDDSEDTVGSGEGVLPPAKWRMT
jgi:hypothetical protein